MSTFCVRISSSLHRSRILFLLLGLWGLATLSAAQNFIDKWQARVNKTQAEQPHWVTPLITVTPRLEQEIRADFVRQIAPNHAVTWNYDNGKGLELIPARRIELIANLPPYLQHTAPKTPDGWGDVSFLMKYRFYAANEEGRNSIVTAFFSGSVPTGTYKNGARDGSVSPTLAAGKGWKGFDVQSTLGGTLPLAHSDVAGRTIAWNSALQYKAGQYAFPELEFNTTWFKGGANDGKKQVFATPGVVARFPIHNRVKLVLGGGMQIALSQFHTFNHGLVFTGRVPF